MKTNFQQRAGALAVGAVLAACSASNDGKHAGAPEVAPTPSAVSASTAKDPRVEEWHKAISKTRPPRTGCFHGSYPSTDWVEVPCVPAPDGPFRSPRPAPSPRAQEPTAHAREHTTPLVGEDVGTDTIGGGGSDWFALLSGEGQITKATGSFPSVSSGISLSTPYSIQLNTNVFKMAYTNNLCYGNANVVSCEGAQQVVYSASTGGLNFEYVFIGPSKCPSGGWSSGPGNNCYLRSQSVSGVPFVGIEDLSSISMVFEPGANDYLAMTIEGKAYSAYLPSVLGVSGWNSVQFGVYGDDNSHQAIFNSPNTSIVTHVDTVTTGGTIGCSSSPGASGDGESGSTTESNNLTLVPNCCLVEGNGISFQESNNPAQACSVCGGQGQPCCSVGNPTCASASDVCYQGTCTACGGNLEPCCAGGTCNGGNTCQLGGCGQPNVLAGSPSSLSVQAGDGASGINKATTYLEASGYWTSLEPNVSPSLSISYLPAGVSWAITNDINPPTVQFTAGANTAPGTYTIPVTGTLGKFQATAYLTLTVGPCEPVTCAASGWVCGSFDDGCGGTSSCGSCPSGESCTGGACYACAARSCPPPEFWNPTTCSCQGCPCGTIHVNGHYICNVCKP
jgi:hypothetical protein